MSDLSTLPDFYGLDGASQEAVANAESKLGLSFAQDYRDYVATYGIASANGHELTGITKADRLDVVKVTLGERKISEAVDASWYVIERIGIDGATAWQDQDGRVFVTIGGIHPKLVAPSLFDYLMQ